MAGQGNYKRVQYRCLVFSYVLLIGWMCVIFFLSSEGNAASTGRSDTIVEALRFLGISGQTDLLTFITRKSAHFFAYLTLGVLTYSALRLHKLTPKFTIAICAAIVVLFAISDEIHQLFVPGRSGEVRDVIIDSVAGIIGIGLAGVYFAYRSKRITANKNTIK